jgi:hypothetical protein
MGRLLPALAAFRDKMKTDSFIDFKIVDHYGSSRRRREGQITYRLEQPMKIRRELRVPIAEEDEDPPEPGFGEVPVDYCSNAPWRRFMYYISAKSLQILTNALQFLSR